MRVLHTDIVAVWNFRDPHDVIFIFALITFILTVLAQWRIQDFDDEHGS